MCFQSTLIDELVQVLNEGSDLSLLEFAVKTLRSLGREVLDDDSIAFVRGCRSMSGSQQGNRRVIVVALDALQLTTTDHMRCCFLSGYGGFLTRVRIAACLQFTGVAEKLWPRCRPARNFFWRFIDSFARGAAKCKDRIG